MSSKNADKAPRKVQQRWSITRRLVVTYTLSAFAMLAISAVFLNWALHVSLMKGEKDYIDDRIRVYQAIIEHSPDFGYFIMHDIEWEGAFVKYPQYYARLLDEQSRTIIETAHMNELIPPENFPVPSEFNIGTQKRSQSVKNVIGGRTYLLESYWAVTVHSARRIAIQIAIDITTQEKIIKTNQQRMITIIILGIIFAALYSFVVARRVLSPIDHLAETAKKISIEQIDVRTDPKSWPMELRALAVAFNDMLGRIEDSYTRLSNSVSNLAHELRTPVNNLMGEAEVALSHDRSPEEYRKVLESSLEENMRLSRLIEAILFLARAENPATHLDLSLFNPLEEIDKVCSYYEALAADKKAELTYHGNGMLKGDRVLFRRAISNLISNALYYSSPGVTIDIAVKPAEEGWLEVAISDTGYGITESDLRRIFDRFFRVSTSPASNPQGSGLGLSIVKSIMEMHNGTITIQSTYGKGTTITLRFPNQEVPK